MKKDEFVNVNTEMYFHKVTGYGQVEIEKRDDITSVKEAKKLVESELKRSPKNYPYYYQFEERNSITSAEDKRKIWGNITLHRYGITAGNVSKNSWTKESLRDAVFTG